MGTFKGIKWKELILDHGEKFVLGIVLVFVLGSVATTQWTTYDRTPEEFRARITQGESAFDASQWPTEKQTILVAGDPSDEVARLLDGTPQGLPLFQYSTRWVWPIRKRKPKLRDPQLPPVIELLADSDKILLRLRREGEQTANREPQIASAEVVNPTSASPDDPTPPGVPIVAVPRNETDGGGTRTTAQPGGVSKPDSLGQDYDSSADSKPQAAEWEALGTRFVALRGVIPMKLIVDQFRQALNLDTPQEAYHQVQFWDFELERQTAVSRQNPWDGDWEAVNIADTIKLLDRLEFDLDIVEEKYREVVFSIPLPYRVTGSWDQASGPHGLIGSHPTIKEILTVRERLQTKARELATLDAARKARLIEQKTMKGLASVQRDTRSLQNQMRSDPELTELLKRSLQEVVERHFSDDDMDAMGDLSLERRAQVVAIPEMLLFRFLDFSVVPGNAYRYRLRLKLQNPNFKRDPSELLDVSSREGRFRFTPWSDPSTPAVVQEETHLFVDKTDQRRGVSINAYQWMTESGTYVNGEFEGLHRAEKIAAWTTEKKSRSGDKTVAGGVLTHVLRPVEETYQEERIDYVTPYSLIDFERTRVINPAEFPDLEVTSRRIPVVLDEVVTINRFGELNHLESNGQAKDYGAWKGLMEQQKILWAHLRQKDKAQSPNADLLESLRDPL